MDGVDAGLGERALDEQRAALAVGLEIDPGDQLLAEQERQHVVAVHPLGGRGVDLDAVAKAEQPLGALPKPDQGVERRQQRAGVDRRGWRAAGQR